MTDGTGGTIVAWLIAGPPADVAGKFCVQYRGICQPPCEFRVCWNMVGSNNSVATEMHKMSETVEPSGIKPAGKSSGVAPMTHAASARRGLRVRLEGARLGRAVLGLSQWAVVFALVATGYIAAGAINAGFEVVAHRGENASVETFADNAPTLLASTSPRD